MCLPDDWWGPKELERGRKNPREKMYYIQILYAFQKNVHTLHSVHFISHRVRWFRVLLTQAYNLLIITYFIFAVFIYSSIYMAV